MRTKEEIAGRIEALKAIKEEHRDVLAMYGIVSLDAEIEALLWTLE